MTDVPLRVVVLGGTGVFGSRIVDMLGRDGHEVWVASRSGGVGPRTITVDRGGDLTPIWAVAPDVVVDAAGPFHGYGDDPYRLPKAAIDRGVNYLDLADEPLFCAGMSALNDAAVAAGVFALSGVSSVPAISSAVAAELTGDAQVIDLIESAILPGNQTPRGRAVVEAILHQASTCRLHPTDGHMRPFRSWSQPKRYWLAEDISRIAYLYEVPDQSLLGPKFGARSVRFRAGLELGVMNHGLAIVSALRLPRPRWFVSSLYWIAGTLERLGTDAGGMVLETIAQEQGAWVKRSWRLVVRHGEGPYVPGIAVRTILADPHGVRAGARPALAEFTYNQLVASLSDLAATITVDCAPLVPIFAGHLGDDMALLPDAVQDLHAVYGPRVWRGRAKVTRGQGWFERALAASFRFPAASPDVPVEVTMERHKDVEIWTRSFGGQTFKSYLRHTKSGITERFGPFTFLLDLAVEDGVLRFPVARGWAFGVPLPRFALPVSRASETVDDAGRFTFDVGLYAPFTQALMVRYQGHLTRN